MAQFVTLSCPSCGARLEIHNDTDRFACAYCGQEHVVQRNGGIIWLKPITDAIRQVKTGVDRTAAELAIARLRDDIRELERRKAAMLKNRPSNRRMIVSLIQLCATICPLAGLLLFLNGIDFTPGGSMALKSSAIGWMVLISFVTVAVLVVIGTGMTRKQRKIAESVGVLDQQIAAKHVELRRHSIVVNGNS